PSLHHFFPVNRNGTSELLLEGALQIRGTGWQRLELASCCVMDSEQNPDQALSDFEGLFSNYQAVVLDLGTPRLDARMLPLVRPTDTVLLVVKYGQTQRKELTTTTAALRAANRSIAGVILNAVTDPVPDSVRRFLNP